MLEFDLVIKFVVGLTVLAWIWLVVVDWVNKTF